MGDTEQRRKAGDSGWEARNGELRLHGEQRTGGKEQRRETGDRGRETRNRDVRQRTEDGR